MLGLVKIFVLVRKIRDVWEWQSHMNHSNSSGQEMAVHALALWSDSVWEYPLQTEIHLHITVRLLCHPSHY